MGEPLVTEDTREDIQLWLEKYIEGRTDADPQAVAHYITALLENQKGEDECTEELKDFFEDAQGVVKEIFAKLKAKSYAVPPRKDDGEEFRRSHSPSPRLARRADDREDRDNRRDRREGFRERRPYDDREPRKEAEEGERLRGREKDRAPLRGRDRQGGSYRYERDRRDRAYDRFGEDDWKRSSTTRLNIRERALEGQQLDELYDPESPSMEGPAFFGSRGAQGGPPLLTHSGRPQGPPNLEDEMGLGEHGPIPIQGGGPDPTRGRLPSGPWRDNLGGGGTRGRGRMGGPMGGRPFGGNQGGGMVPMGGMTHPNFPGPFGMNILRAPPGLGGQMMPPMQMQMPGRFQPPPLLEPLGRRGRGRGGPRPHGGSQRGYPADESVDNRTFRKEELHGGDRRDERGERVGPRGVRGAAGGGGNKRAVATLSIKNVPLELLNVDLLEAHFKRFGKIEKVMITGDAEAIVKYEQHRDMQTALHSPTAVLGNRFIRVYPAWEYEVPGLHEIEQTEMVTEQEQIDEGGMSSAPMAKEDQGNPLLDEVLKRVKEQTDMAEKIRKMDSISESEKADMLKKINDIIALEMEKVKSIPQKKSGVLARLGPKIAGTPSEESHGQTDSQAGAKREREDAAELPAAEVEQDPEYAALKKKLDSLKRQATEMAGGAIRGRGRGVAMRGSFRGRGRGAGWNTFVAGSGRGAERGVFPAKRTLDNRPKSLRVSGGTEDDLHSTVLALEAADGVLSVEREEDGKATIHFASRQQAEKALSFVKKGKEEGEVKIEWVARKTPASNGKRYGSAQPTVAGGVDEEKTAGVDLMEEEEEEEDDGERDRSWRR